MSSDNKYVSNVETELHNRNSRDVGSSAIIIGSSTIAGIGCSLTSGPLAPVLGPICGAVGGIIGAVIADAIKGELFYKPEADVKPGQYIDPEALRFSKYMYQIEISLPHGVIFRENIPLNVGDVFIYSLRGIGRVTFSDKPPVTAFIIGGPTGTTKLIYQSGETLTQLGQPAVRLNLLNVKGAPEYLQQDNVSISSSSTVGYAPVCIVDWMVVKSSQYSGFIDEYISAIKARSNYMPKLNIEGVYLGPQKEATPFTLGHSTT